MIQNNSNEMKTAVETFVIEETAELIYDNEKLSEWNRLVEELGLKGQTKITQKDKSPIPFMPLNQVLKTTFETLCPRKVDAKEYDVTPIPVEILSLISLSTKEEYFQKIEIWYDEKTKDPACIGITSKFYVSSSESNPENIRGKYFQSEKVARESGYNSKSGSGWYIDQHYYLIGKWADVKHSFSALIELAKKRYINQSRVNFQKQITEAQRELNDLELKAAELFSNDNI